MLGGVHVERGVFGCVLGCMCWEGCVLGGVCWERCLKACVFEGVSVGRGVRWEVCWEGSALAGVLEGMYV